MDSLSRPIVGHTPRKLPRFRAISRIIADCALGRRSVIIQQHTRVCQGFFKSFFGIFYEISGVFFVHYILCPQGLFGHKSPARTGRAGAYTLYIMCVGCASYSTSMAGTTAAQRGHRVGWTAWEPTRGWFFQQRAHFSPSAADTATDSSLPTVTSTWETMNRSAT